MWPLASHPQSDCSFLHLSNTVNPIVFCVIFLSTLEIDIILIPFRRWKKVRLSLGQGKGSPRATKSEGLELSLELKPPDSQAQH